MSPATGLAAGLYAWLAPIGLLLGVTGLIARLTSGQATLERVIRLVAWAYGVAVAVAWVARYRLAGHLPLFGTYESALSLALMLMAAAMLWEWIGRRGLPLTPLAALLSGLLLLHGDEYDPTPYALTISERSWVVDIHAWIAWAAFAVLAVNAIVALWIVLAKEEIGTSAEQGERAVGLPGTDAAEGQAGGADGREQGRALSAPGEEVGGRWLVLSLELGFFLHTAMLASGSFYKFLLFGTAWSFDPIETLGFIAWMAYGTLLHMHLFAHWRGRRLASWCLALFVLLVVSYRGIVYFPAWSTYHIFDMDLRMHLTGDEVPGGVL